MYQIMITFSSRIPIHDKITIFHDEQPNSFPQYKKQKCSNIFLKKAFSPLNHNQERSAYLKNENMHRFFLQIIPVNKTVIGSGYLNIFIIHGGSTLLLGSYIHTNGLKDIRTSYPLAQEHRAL